MLELKQKTYWEISVNRVESLILEHFSIQLDIILDMEIINQDYVVINSRFESQALDRDTINYCLLDSESKCERLHKAIWCLIMKDVIPEGNYLVSIFW